MNQAGQGDTPRGNDESFPRISLPYNKGDSSDPEGCSRADQEVQPGGRIAHFRLEQELGRGAMGIVHLAYDTRLDRHVAIKSLPQGVVDKPAASSLWEREARLLASVNHPNIASIYDRLEGPKGRGYLVLEYVPGQTLAERMAEGPLGLEETLTIAMQIAEAVSAAHEHGVIHRDLKPGNVKITPEGRVKVLDFGIAKAVGSAPSGEQNIATLAGNIIGTPAYMSPEQARGKSVDARADVWSFGCIMFEMFSGRVPFEGATVADTLARVIEREPDWDLIPRHIPRNMFALVRRCLNKDPGQRLRDLGDAALEIGETLRSLVPRPPETEVASGSDVFISHVKEDADIARRIARGLKEAGYTTWHYEHDSTHGPSYEEQVTQAIEQAKVVLLVISQRSLVSAQMTSEVLAAYESHKHFVPVLYGITRTDFQKHQPVWRQRLGRATFISVPLQGVRPILPRIINGLASLGVQPPGSLRSVEQAREACKHKYLMLPKYERRRLAIGLCLLAGLLVGVSWIIWFRSEPAESPKPPATMRFQHPVMHLIRDLKKSVRTKDRIGLLRRITGADGVRTQFDVVLENEMYLLLKTDPSIKLVRSMGTTADTRPFEVTVKRDQNASAVTLSGSVRDASKLTEFDPIQIDLDDRVNELLSRRVATPEEVRDNPGLEFELIELPPLELTYSITGMHKTDDSWEPVAVRTGTSLDSGDCFKINCRTNEGCFFYAILCGSGGDAEYLFPQGKKGVDNAIEGGTIHSLPAGEQWYYLDSVPGTETIYLVASYEPMRNVAEVMAQVVKADSDKRLDLFRTIQTQISNVQIHSLQSSTYVISIFRDVPMTARRPESELEHQSKLVKAVNEVVRGFGSVVKIVSFEHR